jgi:hypothetical protein
MYTNDDEQIHRLSEYGDTPGGKSDRDLKTCLRLTTSRIERMVYNYTFSSVNQRNLGRGLDFIQLLDKKSVYE